LFDGRLTAREDLPNEPPHHRSLVGRGNCELAMGSRPSRREPSFFREVGAISARMYHVIVELDEEGKGGVGVCVKKWESGRFAE